MDCIKLKIKNEVIEEVEKLLIKGYSYSQISKLTGVSKATISRVKNKTYKKTENLLPGIDEKKYKSLKLAFEKSLKDNKFLVNKLNQSESNLLLFATRSKAFQEENKLLRIENEKLKKELNKKNKK